MLLDFILCASVKGDLNFIHKSNESKLAGKCVHMGLRKVSNEIRNGREEAPLARLALATFLSQSDKLAPIAQCTF